MRALLLNQWQWQGPARFPRALKRAGWEVATICKQGEWASLTRHVDRFYHVDTNDEHAIFQAIEQALKEWQPDVVLPGSDNMVDSLQKFRYLVEQGRIVLPREALKTLMSSTFPLQAMPYVCTKIDMLEALKARGVRVAPQREVGTIGDVDAFVQEHGYPVVLKPDRGFAGEGIEFCNDEDELFESLNKLKGKGRFSIQKYLGTKTGQIEFVAKDGEIVALNSVYRLRTHPGHTGQTSVARVVSSPEMAFAAKEMARLLHYNGIGCAQFMVEDESCQVAYLIELNPRFSSFVHLWGILGTDLAQALKDAWSGKRTVIQSPPVGLTMALYPQETLRDPESEFLKGLKDNVDDDPELRAAYEEAIAKAHATSGRTGSR